MKALGYENILLKHRKCIVNSRSECDISTEIAGKKIACPVFCSSMPAVLNLDICRLFDKSGWFHCYHRFNGIEDILNYVRIANKENWNFCSISIGMKENDLAILSRIVDENLRLDSINIDVALSWSDKMQEMIKWVRAYFPKTYLIVGDGDNPDWIHWLEDLGVDAAKIYIGVSSACRTREYTGFGSTTITDLANCASAANKIKIICDGGITSCVTGEPAIGDVAKAIRFGASFIQSGFLFSQCLDSPSLREGYYGNSTAKAKKHYDNIEGAILNVKTNGLTIKEQIKLVEDSLRSSVSYAGGNKLEDLRKVDYIII